MLTVDLFCYLWFTVSMSRKTQAVIISIVSIAAILGSVYFTASLVQAPQPVVVEQPVKKEVKPQDPQLVDILERSGVTVPESVGLAYVDSFEQETARGRYLNGDVMVKKGLAPDVEQRVVVHEYLHYVWFRVMSEEQKLALSDKLLNTFTDDPAMQERLYRYTELDILTNTELFSFYCTEVNDQFIASFVDECNKYFDRSTLTLLR